MRHLILFLLIFSVTKSHANSCNPAPAGKMRRNGVNLEFCDGLIWQAVGDGNSTGDACAPAETGKIKFAPDNWAMDTGMIYCDGVNWISTRVALGAACTTPGVQRYNSGTMEYCATGAATWIDMKTSNLPAYSICGMNMASGPCNADPQCYWTAGSCQTCICKQP